MTMFQVGDKVRIGPKAENDIIAFAGHTVEIIKVADSKMYPYTLQLPNGRTGLASDSELLAAGTDVTVTQKLDNRIRELDVLIKPLQDERSKLIQAKQTLETL